MLERHFVTSYQQVGNFKVTNVQGQLRKNGGNVAAYFCTPEGRVLHATAGPVSADELLDAAHWTLQRYGELEARPPAGWMAALSLAHQQAVSPAPVSPAHVPRPRLRTAGWRPEYTASWQNASLGKQQRVHLLLAHRPLAPLAHVYREVFEEILNEEVHHDSPNLVLAERGLRIAERTGRPMLFILHDGSHQSGGYEQWLAIASRCRADDPDFFPLVSRYIVMVLPWEEMPAFSRRLKQPPFEAPGSSALLLVVTRSDGHQLAAYTGSHSAGQLSYGLASGLVDAYQRNPPRSTELRRVTRLLKRVDLGLAESLREIGRQRYAARDG